MDEYARAAEDFCRIVQNDPSNFGKRNQSRHHLFPTLLERGEERKPTLTRRADAFRKAYQDRVNRIDAQRIEILVEQLESEPRRPAAARRKANAPRHRG